MRRSTIPFFLACLAATPALAQSYLPVEELEFYGRLNVALHNNDFEDAGGDEQQDNWTLESHISMAGIRGIHTLQKDLRAVFQLEYEVFVDDGDDGSGDDSEFRQRNSYLGLEGNWGRVIAGKHDTPLKLAQGKVDRFSDLLLGDLRNAMEGENRPDNIVMYRSPWRENWRFRAAFIPGEESGTGAGDDDSLADAFSVSAEYVEGKNRLAIAHDNGESIDPDVDHATRLVIEHNDPEYSLGAILQVADFDGGGDEETILLSGALPVDERYVLNAQAAYSDLPGGHRTQQTIGLDYRLGANAKAYGYVSRIAETVGPDSRDLTAGFGFKFLFSR